MTDYDVVLLGIGYSQGGRHWDITKALAGAHFSVDGVHLELQDTYSPMGGLVHGEFFKHYRFIPYDNDQSHRRITREQLEQLKPQVDEAMSQFPDVKYGLVVLETI